MRIRTWNIIISFHIIRPRFIILEERKGSGDSLLMEKVEGTPRLQRHSKQHISPITLTGKEFAIQVSLSQVKHYSI